MAKSYGLADIEDQSFLDALSTVLEWGSISKTFVRVSGMQLVEAGKEITIIAVTHDEDLMELCCGFRYVLK